MASADEELAQNASTRIKELDNEKRAGADREEHSINVERGEAHGIPMIMKHGRRLHPQPTSDPLDPLNWSRTRKNIILAIVMSLYFMFTYITTTTVPAFPDLQEYYGISLMQANWTVAVPALGLAIGPLLCSSPADIFGRRVVFIGGTVIALVSTIGAGMSTTYDTYMVARFFQGLGASPAATVGLAIINDTFFEYQRGFRIGLWVLAIDMGLLIGPLVGGFVLLVDQFWIQWLTAILFGVILVLEVAFLPETLYPRNMMLRRMPYVSTNAELVDFDAAERDVRSEAEVEVKRTIKLPFLIFRPVPGMRHPSIWDTVTRFVAMFKYLPISLTVFVYSFGWYWWMMSIVTYIPVAYAQYSAQVQGLLFIGLILGTLFSEVFVSGRLSDYIVLRLAKKNHNVKIPEMRLWLIYPAGLVCSVGLVLWGISIDRSYHWMVGQIAFFIFGGGIQTGNTIVAAYVVDCYQLQSMSVITFWAVIINLSAFVNPFFIVPWVESQGFTMVFAIQGIITFFFGVPALAALHYYGPRLRSKCGVPGWVNPEFDSII